MGERRAESLQGEPVGVRRAAADDVAAGQAQGRLLETREQRAREQQRGPDVPGQLRIDDRLVDVRGADLRRVRIEPLHRGAEADEDLEHAGHVSDPWQIAEDDRLARQQACGDQRQCRVLVALRRDLAAQWGAAFDDEARHRRVA